MTMSPKKSFFIQTYGCQMNEADSQTMARVLAADGYTQAASAEEAAVIILNTCCVRAKPEQKASSRLGELRILKQQRPDLIIGMAGCMAQKDGQALLNKTPFLDLVIGTRQFHRLAELIHACQQGQRLCALGLEDDPSAARLVECGSGDEKPEAAETPVSGLTAFVPIILGCDNYCTYCIVPYVRGRQKSRTIGEIREEVAALVAGGCKEVTLLGQNVLAYGRDLQKQCDFADLLAVLNDIPGLQRIRFTTAHPRDVNDKLIDAVASLPRVCEHFHLPIQAGHDGLLKAMGRGYTTQHYLQMATFIRARIPDVSITTDIMVGFPGETEDEFAASMELYEKLAFDQAFTFIYSPRPGTPAAKLPEQIPYRTKQARLMRLVEVINTNALRINEKWVGREVEVLVDGTSDKDVTRLSGRLRNNKLVIFPGAEKLVGQLVQVRITSATLWGLHGESI
jgi:tRNA-2-methylthio-N6-dimethylallyladenosine synthase